MFFLFDVRFINSPFLQFENYRMSDTSNLVSLFKTILLPEEEARNNAESTIVSGAKSNPQVFLNALMEILRGKP